jgi:hypothetical protein
MANNAGHYEALDACHLDIAQHIKAPEERLIDPQAKALWAQGLPQSPSL